MPSHPINGRLDTTTTANELNQEIKNLKEENENLRNIVEGYRVTNNDKALENLDLRNEVNGLRERLAAVDKSSRGSGWSVPKLSIGAFGAFFSKYATYNQQPDDDSVVELSTNSARHEDRIRELEEENRKLRATITEKERQIDAQTADFARELEDIRSKELIRTPRVSDKEIQGRWKSLVFSVRQFVSAHLPGSLDQNTVQSIAELDDFKWLPEITKTMRAPLLCHVVLESWIWHFLCFRIFDSQSKFWAGDIGQAFSVQREKIFGHITKHGDSLPPAATIIAQFHDWRVRSTHFMSQLMAPGKEGSISQTTENMLSSLGKIVQYRSSHEMRADALQIVRQASELDDIFRKSKADFHVFITRVKVPLVTPPSFGFAFDPETMECTKDFPDFPRGNSTQTVDLAVSPGIFKAGNSDGANYDSERVLVKLQALCNLQAILEVVGVSEAVQGVGDQECQTGEGSGPYIKQEHEDDEVVMLCVDVEESCPEVKKEEGE